MSGPLRVSFRALAADDLPRLTRWLNEPHVTRFWEGPRDLEAVRQKYLPRIEGAEPVHCKIVCWDGVPCGMFQHYPCDHDPEWANTVGALAGEVGIDFLIGEEVLTGRGLGPQMLAVFLEQEVLADPAVTGVRADINAGNRRSRRVLEKLGFAHEAGRDFSEDGVRYVIYRASR